MPLLKVGDVREPAEAEAEAEAEAPAPQPPQLMVCREWPLERVVAQAAWQCHRWPRRLLQASPVGAKGRTLTYTTVRLSTLRPFVHPSFLEAEAATTTGGGEMQTD